MFNYLAMSYKDSDYTTVIALVCWSQPMNFGAETRLSGGCYECFCLPVNHHCSGTQLWRLLAVQLSGTARIPSCNNYHLCAKTHPGGKVV